MARANVRFNKAGWNQIVKDVIDTEGVRRMKRVADAANQNLDGPDGYLVSTEGDEPLTQRDYTATVITASAEAQRDNAKRNTLVQNLHRAGGD